MPRSSACVPAVTGFDDAGASVDAAQVAKTMEWDDVMGLGEMMNFPGILGGEQNALDEVAETLKAGKCVTGHYSVSETDRGLAAYISSGVRACHESITPDDVIEVPVRDGKLEANPEIDALKMAVFDRHHGAAGTHSYGFCTGFGVHGALAQTVSHDSHNLLVVGDNDEDMTLAARTLVECGGGEVAVADGKVLALVELPVCGLMSDRHVEDVAAEVAGIEQAWADMGCKMPSPFMTMGILSLPCVPELRLTNRGYVNCVTF